MERYIYGFVGGALLYFTAGVTLGLYLLLQMGGLVGGPVVPKFVHVHLNLLGFVVSMIFGISYHVLPRFGGKELYSVKMARLHFLLHTLGLPGLLVSVAAAYTVPGLFAPGMAAAAVSAGMVVFGAYLFAANMFLTFRALGTGAGGGDGVGEEE